MTSAVITSSSKESVTYVMTYATQHIGHGTCHSAPGPTIRACRNIRSTTDVPQTTPDTNRTAPLRMSGHTQRNKYPTSNDPHWSTRTITYAGTYAARQIPRSQQPPPDIIATCVCADIRNRTKDGGTGTSTGTSTGTTVSPDKQRAIDHLDRNIRRRITARVWRAAAPRRPRSSSTRAD